MITVDVEHAGALRALGERLGRLLRPGHTVALVGDLGAGKTTLSQGIGAALGAEEVQSPTFIVVREHPEAELVHADLYRVEDEAELAQLGLEERLGGEVIALIEWADRFPDLLPADHLVVRIVEAGGGRAVTVSATGPQHARLVEALDAAPARP